VGRFERPYYAVVAAALVVFSVAAAVLDVSEASQVYAWCGFAGAAAILGRILFGPDARGREPARWAWLPLVVAVPVLVVLISGRFKTLVLTGALVVIIAVVWALDHRAATGSG
jgi:hypothetical protein